MAQSSKKEPRNLWLHVKVSATEREHLKMLALSRNQTVSDLVRESLGVERLSNVAPRRRQRRTSKADPVLIAALGRLGNNLNQIARWVNVHKGGASSVEVLAALVAINRDLKSLLPEKETEKGGLGDVGSTI